MHEFCRIPRAGWMDIAKRNWAATGKDDFSLPAAGVAFHSQFAFGPATLIATGFGHLVQRGRAARGVAWLALGTSLTLRVG